MTGLGGYSDFQTPNAEQLALFAKFKSEILTQANGEALGEPTQVATQVVNGTNFCFKVKAGDKEYAVVIHQQGPWAGGEATLTSVTAA
jgi:hypothetical protein